MSRTRQPGLPVGRRGFLAALAALGAGCRPTHTRAPAPTRDGLSAAPSPTPAPETITADTIAAAERLVGVEYTDAEREQILQVLDEHITRAISARTHELPNELAPATVFNPGPPPARRSSSFRPTRVRPPPVPKSLEDIAFAPATVLGSWVQNRLLTSERLTELYLDRLERHGPKLACVVTLTPERALERARAADREIARGHVRGPLHGVPWGAKDLLDTKGIATTWGAGPFRARVPQQDATVVSRLDAAGAVLVAKLTLGALAYGDVWFGGRTNNPWNVREGSSGSSAGPAAATAAGLVGFSIGTETLGSIVSPCMRCGTTGLRPTFGRVPRDGAMALCWSLDKIGPIARTVEDTIVVLAAINGAAVGDPSSRTAALEFRPRRSIRGLRVGYDPRWFERGNEVDRDALAELHALGLEAVELELPELPYPALLTILYAEAAAAFERLTASGDDDALAWQDEVAWPNTFRASRFLSAIDLVQADRLRREVMGVMAGLFERVDVMIGPSYAGNMLLITNCTGHPSLTLRTGFVRRPSAPDIGAETKPDPSEPRFQAPHGLTLWGRLFDEGTLVRVGMALEANLGVAARRPPGFGSS